MRLSEVFPSRYLKSIDIGDDVGVSRAATIDRVKMELFGSGREQESKVVVYFSESDLTKGLVLNKTNGQSIAEMYGDDTDLWVGQPITLVTAAVQFEGKVTVGIRILPKRVTKPAPKPTAKIDPAGPNPKAAVPVVKPVAKPAVPAVVPAAKKLSPMAMKPAAKPAPTAAKKPTLPVKKGAKPAVNKTNAIESVVAKYTAAEVECSPELVDEGITNILTQLDMIEDSADWAVVVDRIEDAFIPAINCLSAV